MKEELGLKRTLGDVLHGISICTQLRTIDMCTFVDNWFEMDPVIHLTEDPANKRYAHGETKIRIFFGVCLPLLFTNRIQNFSPYNRAGQVKRKSVCSGDCLIKR